MAGELLAVAAQRELSQLDEKLYFEVFAPPQSPRSSKAAAGARRP
jgi:general secretion pathway protein A